MPQRLILDVTTEAVAFTLILSSDNQTPATGVTPTLVQLSKAGAPFAPPSGPIAEPSPGAYEFRPALGDVSALGPCVLHIEAPGCQPLDQVFDVATDENSPLLIQSRTTYPLLFLMTSDGLVGAPGLLGSLTVEIYKPEGTWAAPSGTVAEVGFGVYALFPAASDVDIPGPLRLKGTAPGAWETVRQFDVSPGPIAPSSSASIGLEPFPPEFYPDTVGIVEPVDDQDSSGGPRQFAGTVTILAAAVQSPRGDWVAEQSTLHGIEHRTILFATDPEPFGAMRVNAELRWLTHYGVVQGSSIGDGSGNLVNVPYTPYWSAGKPVKPGSIGVRYAVNCRNVR